MRLCVLIASLLAFPTLALADEVEDFEAARALYNRGDYAGAVARFEAMVGDEVPVIRNEVLVLESRKYLAASYLFEDRRPDAERQFEWLLRQEPQYTLDPVAFPAAVHDTFTSVQTRLQSELAEREAAREAAERELRERSIQRLLDQQRRIARLEALASEIEVEQQGSRWLAALPFGVGQFQNGHRGLGLALMSLQVFLATTSLATSVYHGFLSRRPEEEIAGITRLGDGIRITNWVSTSLLGAVAIGGIIDAQARFRSVRTTRRSRPLPEDLQDLEPIEEDVLAAPIIQLQLGAGYAGLRLEF